MLRGVLLSHYGPRWAGPLLTQNLPGGSPDGGFAVLDFLNAAARAATPAIPTTRPTTRRRKSGRWRNRRASRTSQILGEPEWRVLLLLAGRFT